MANPLVKQQVENFVSDYGMIFVLLLLCIIFSWATWSEQHPSGEAAGRLVADQIADRLGTDATVFVVATDSVENNAFVDAVQAGCKALGIQVVGKVTGQPVDTRKAVDAIIESGKTISVIACTQNIRSWGVFDALKAKHTSLKDVAFVVPESYWWPVFLKSNNLLNIANQIAVIAILAIGMTMVIITGGIDLSVGSLIALSAVVAAWLIREYCGGVEANAMGMTISAIGAIVVCGGIGMFTGVMVTTFDIPPFISTLSVMMVASGLAYMLAGGQSVNDVPDSFVWLGRGADLFGLPNAVVLMLVLYVIAHFMMTRMSLGRYIYAVGGNAEAARLSGVPVKRILLFVYTICGALAGLGGVVLASQLKSGGPTYGKLYELYVIAAVVVGGTSLSGGEGKVLGTLIGAFIIAVIQNGMNLTGVESYTQLVVLGMVILLAVLIDRVKKAGWIRLAKRRDSVGSD